MFSNILLLLDGSELGETALLKAEGLVEEGAVADTTIEYTVEHDIDPILMSTHGFGAIKRQL